MNTTLDNCRLWKHYPTQKKAGCIECTERDNEKAVYCWQCVDAWILKKDRVVLPGDTNHPDRCDELGLCIDCLVKKLGAGVLAHVIAQACLGG